MTLTNKQWLFSLSNRKLANFLSNCAEIICNEAESCAYESDKHKDSCNQCVRQWLKSERIKKKYLVNCHNEEVEIPAVGTTMYLVNTTSTGELVISEFKWKNLKRYFLALYNGIVFSKAVDAKLYINEQRNLMDWLTKGLGSENISY